MKIVTRASLAPIMAALAWFAFPSGTASAQEAAPKPEAAVAAPASPAAPAEAEKPKDPVADALGYPPGLNAGTKLDLQWPVPAESKSVNPDGKDEVSMDELVQNVAHNKVSINMVWVLITGFMVMFMQAGFALVETGLCRAKHAAHVMATNLLIYPLGMIGFWICGFAFMFGGYFSGPVAIGWQPPFGQGLQLLSHEFSIELFGKPFGLIGTAGFFLGNDFLDTAVFALFLFQMVFMDTTATIPTGSMAERWNFKNFIIYGLWVGSLCYPIYGNWVWGGGWLAQLGINFGLGHGHVDFAGSSVVHMTGGVLALVGSIIIGPRLGKYGADGRPHAIPGHNVPYVLLGTFILAFGWFGFNPGSTLAGTDNHAAIVAVNTMLASAGGALATTLYLYLTTGKPDPTMICNGMLAGLVAITAPCAFVSSLGSVIIGLISGVLVVLSVNFFDRVARIDDPVGAISVHGVCGAFGVLSVGIFSNGSYGAGWGGVHTLLKDGTIQTVLNDGTPEALKKYAELTGGGWADQGVTGILGPLFGGNYADWGQLSASGMGVLANIVFVGIAGYVWFKLSNLIFPLRSSKQDEMDGLDIPEMGVEAYPDFHLTDRSSPHVH
jgi:Amt family ammonium transporter